MNREESKREVERTYEEEQRRLKDIERLRTFNIKSTRYENKHGYGK